MAKARSISAANLSKFTQAVVWAATHNSDGRFSGRGPIMGTSKALSSFLVGTSVAQLLTVPSALGKVQRLARGEPYAISKAPGT
jgi:hypothetical protein